MTFDHILSQVLELLQRQGRVSYRSLKRRFDLDDDYIEDLKEEMLFAYPVVDEEGRGFVWTGEVERQPVSTSIQPALQEIPPAIQPTQAEPALHGSPPPEAERRQLTVMFCDLVDSTQLSSQLDPEEYREVVRAYQRACTEVIRRYDGHVAQLLGDGLLVYFGYPLAHEDDAHRAVRTGLGILDAMEDLNTSSATNQRYPTGCPSRDSYGAGRCRGNGRSRATGAVCPWRDTQMSLRESKDWLQPNTLVVSGATYRLIQGYFDCQDLGAQTLRGVAEPITVYRVLQREWCHSRLDIAQPRGLTPLVGRESGSQLLLERWEQVKAGQGQVVLLSGDAGIGKVPVGPNAQRPCRPRAAYALGMSEFPVLSKHGALSSDRFVPTAVAVPSTRRPLTRNWRNSNRR